MPKHLIDSGTQSLSGNLSITGSFSVGYTEKTSNYTVLSSDHTVNCLSGSFVVTLPPAIYNTIYVIKNSGTGLITLSANGSETIDGYNTILITQQWQSMVVQGTSLGSWVII